MNERITYHPDGVLDEIVLTGVDRLHLERMGEAQWWLGIEHKGQTLMVNIGAINDRAKGYGHAEWDTFDGPPAGAPAATNDPSTKEQP